MSFSITDYKGANSNRGPSPGLWANCSIPPWRGTTDPNLGWGWWDDFTEKQFSTPTAEGNWGRYKAFTSSGGVLGVGDEIGGVLTMTEGTNDEGVTVAMVQTPFQISRSHGNLWFEARLKCSTVADTRYGFFCGLNEAQTYTVGSSPINTSGAITDDNVVGWHRLEGDGDAMDFVYKADGVSQVTVLADGATLAADTYIKVGFFYDSTNFKLTPFVNGVASSTTYTVASAAGTDFPNDVRMGLCLAQMMAAGNSDTTSVDWVAIAQMAAGA